MIDYLLDVLDVTIKGFIGGSFIVGISAIAFWIWWGWGKKDKGRDVNPREKED